MIEWTLDTLRAPETDEEPWSPPVEPRATGFGRKVLLGLAITGLVAAVVVYLLDPTR